jgi:hypothetical protein
MDSSLLPLCGIIASKWPNWLSILPTIGLRLEWLWIQDSEILQLVTCLGLIPLGTILVRDSADLHSHQHKFSSRLVFLDGGRSNCPSLWPLSYSHLQAIVTLGWTKRSPAGWLTHKLSVSHCDVGGVSDTVTHFRLWLPASTPTVVFDPTLPVSIPRDLSTVVDDMVELGVKWHPPRVTRPEPPRVLQLRPKLFHGFGLYPVLPQEPQFLVPSVFSPSGWVIRRLTLVERLLVMDFSDSLSRKMRPSDQQTVLLSLVPGKSMMAAYKRFGPLLTDTMGDSKETRNGGSSGRKRNICEVTLADEQSLSVTSIEPITIDSMMFSTPMDHSTKVMNVGERHLKATKDDDADIPIQLWMHFLTTGLSYVATSANLGRVIETLQQFLLRAWRRKLTKTFCAWLRRTPLLDVTDNCVHWDATWGRYGKDINFAETYKNWWVTWTSGRSLDITAGVDVITRAATASWWTWDTGSRCLHWKWPIFYQMVIRDGLDVLLIQSPTPYLRAQRGEADGTIRKQVMEKLNQVRAKGYIGPGHVKSLTSFFAVPKGEMDVRMVYDASVSGLNDLIWVPRFPLPTIGTHLRAVEKGTYMGDLDVGEMFLNFVLHKNLQELCGVDLTKFLNDDEATKNGTRVWEVWLRAAMGVKSSPYQAVQAITIAEEVILGDQCDPANVFRWDRVRLNLPGFDHYDPSLPWVSKVRTMLGGDGSSQEIIAADLFIYVDDARVTGSSALECWTAQKKVAAGLSSLGIQDAARKRRGPRQDPGAWAGSVLRIDGVVPEVQVSEEKWAKTKALVEELLTMLTSDWTQLPHRRLLEIRGFLIYVTRTYKHLTPYLKGLHLTIDGWRANRDTDGWRLRDRDVEAELDTGEGGRFGSDTREPTFVRAVRRLKDDIRALQNLTSANSPPIIPVRCASTGAVYYGFGDASGKAFGSTFQFGGDIVYRYGQWCSEITEESSNYRELLNLVEALEGGVKAEKLKDCEVFMFTDNSTAEAAYYKGNSKSRHLFELVVRLRGLAMKAGLLLHVIHVSGKWMIAQGTDGLSRGDHTEGVMQGRNMTEYIPLHLSAIERCSGLKDWLTSVLGAMEHSFLDPEGWFTTGQQFGNFIWTPPPAATEVMVELLGKARHKRPESLHLIVVPRLMTGYWRRAMLKECDCYFQMSLGFEYWPAVMYEPLIFFVCLPFRANGPNSFLGTRCMADLVRELRGKELWEGPSSRSRDILCELLTRARSVVSLPE